MVRKTIVYHVGAHKTASSLLQKFMRDNRAALRKQRISYLSRSEMNEYVGWGKRLLTHPERLEGRVAQALTERWCRTLVISHENTLGPPLKEGAAHLYPRGPELMGQLARTLRRWPTRAFLYIRPQDEFLESYYLQCVHQGQHLTFAEWLGHVDLEALSWRPLADALVDHFGVERVEVLDFELIRQGQNAFIADFLRRVDPTNTIEPDYRPIRNASISDKGLKIALAANRHLHDDGERKAMRTFLQKHFSNQRYPRPILFSDEDKRSIRMRYAREYQDLTGRALAHPPSAEGTGGR